MLKKWHVLVNTFTIGLVTMFILPVEYIGLGLGATLLSALFPDFDIAFVKLKLAIHRDIFFHSAITPILVLIGGLFLNSFYTMIILSIFSIGCGIHLLVDFFPKFKLRGFGLIHVFKKAKKEKFSLNWLYINTLITLSTGILIILLL